MSTWLIITLILIVHLLAIFSAIFLIIPYYSELKKTKSLSQDFQESFTCPNKSKEKRGFEEDSSELSELIQSLHANFTLKEGKERDEKVEGILGKMLDFCLFQIEAHHSTTDYRTLVPVPSKLLEMRKLREMQNEVFKALKRIGPSAVEPLIEVFKKNKYDVELQDILIKALVKIGPVAEKSLIETLKKNSDDYFVRETLVEVLRKIGLSATEMMTAELDNPDRNVRNAVLTVLKSVGWWPAVNLGNESRQVQTTAVQFLGKIGNVGAAELLVESLENHRIGLDPLVGEISVV